MMRVPSTKEYYPSFIVYAPVSEFHFYFDNYIVIIAPFNAIFNIKMSGTSIPFYQFTQISSEFFALMLPLDSADVHSLIYSDNGQPFMVFQFSFSSFDSISFPAIMYQSKCPGANEHVDFNNDHYPDCAFPPPVFELVDPSWMCGVDSVFYCDTNLLQTNCDYYSIVLSTYFNPMKGVFLGPCIESPQTIPIIPE